MKAFGLADEGSPAAVLDIPAPEVGPGEVRIRVRASSVNGWDAFVASGMARGVMEHRFPVVVGKDFAGVVESVGEGVSRFVVGDEVAGICPPEPFVGRGSYAELVVVPAEGYIGPKPANLDVEHAASVGLAALTGIVTVDTVEASSGDLICIVGATGGVGAYAVQLAAGRGARVIATGLPEDEDWIRGLGAAEVVDYAGDVSAAVRAAHPEGVDAMIVAVALGEAFGPTVALVKDEGRLATVAGGDVEPLAGRGVHAASVFAQSDPAPFATVLRMAGDGSLSVPITRTYAFEELPEALGLVGKRRSRGKVAIAIGG